MDERMSRFETRAAFLEIQDEDSGRPAGRHAQCVAIHAKVSSDGTSTIRRDARQHAESRSLNKF